MVTQDQQPVFQPPPEQSTPPVSDLYVVPIHVTIKFKNQVNFMLNKTIVLPNRLIIATL